jgi:hypothetical protein
MVGGRRVDGVQYAQRVNAAAALVEAGVPVAEATGALASRFGVSVRQARRYVDQAVAGGRRAVPEPSVVFTVKLPAALAARVRAYARGSQTTISAVVTRALTEFLTQR